jgi:Flp pilus assembly protein TadG
MSSLSAAKTLLNAVTATGASSAVQVDGGQPLFLQVSGITSATVTLQGSLDGTTWATLGSALTADGLITIANAPKYVRANCTVYVSGTITAKILY